MKATFPQTRMRRKRQAAWSRDLFAEYQLTPADFIYPLFVTEGSNQAEPIEGLPGQFRYSVDRIGAEARLAEELGIPLVCLFPNTPQDLRDKEGSEALNPDNLLCRAIQAIKSSTNNLGVMADVALDPYTDHGHDGVLIDGRVANDLSVERLSEQALLLAKAGADVLAPSDMMDGRIGAIRHKLEEAGDHDRLIISYAAKYASSFYGPFREAVGAAKTLSGDKKTYQMDPRNAREALLESELDAYEGADALIIKPGLPYLDILAKVSDNTALPVIAYQVSGEYAMIHAAAEKKWIDGPSVMFESLTAFKRAGARAIISYAALEASKRLQ